MNKTKVFDKKIGIALIIFFLSLFSVNIIIRNNSYYDISKKSFIWTWLFSTNRTLRGFPVVQPEGEVMYDFRGYESNTLGMQEYQIEYVTKTGYKQVLDTSIKYLEEKGYLLEQTNSVDCTWKTPSHVNKTTQYYKDSIKRNHACLTFVITQSDNNLTYVKLFLMR